MDTNYSQEQETFRHSLRRLLADKAGTQFARKHWSNSVSYAEELKQDFVDLGITGLLAPESAGGLNGEMSDFGIVMEELGRSVLPSPCWSSMVGATTAARLFHCEQLLEALVNGNKIATLALEEKDHSFLMWRQPLLTALIEEQSKELTEELTQELTQELTGKLSGKKYHVHDAVVADYFFVTARDGVYLVAKEEPGLSIVPQASIDGSRKTAHIIFNNVKGIRVGNIEQLQPVIDKMLVALSADGLGAAQKSLELAVQYAKERVQFEQPIGSFQAIQHLCSDMLQRLEMGRAGLHYALWSADHASPQEAHRAAVMVKAFMSEYFPKIAADAIQLFGGIGFTWELDIHLYYKRLLSLELTWGGADVWLEELARIAFD